MTQPSSPPQSPQGGEDSLQVEEREKGAVKEAVRYIVLHCTDTYPSANFTIEKLQASHRARGFGPYPGYHFYVRRDGTLYYCRPITMRGCHAKGYNTGSIAVCYEGGRKEECRHGACPHALHPMTPWEDNRTPEQQVTLHHLLATLLQMFPGATLLGHRDLPGVHKACPCLDTRHEYAYLLTPHP